jgi:hypothetical protein
MKHLLKKMMTHGYRTTPPLAAAGLCGGTGQLASFRSGSCTSQRAGNGGPNRTATCGLLRKERHGERGKDQLQDRRAGAGGRRKPRTVDLCRRLTKSWPLTSNGGSRIRVMRSDAVIRTRPT